MTEVEIGTLFASFGPVKSCHLVINADASSALAAATAAAAAAAATTATKAAAGVPHRGYGFVEYFSPESAAAAVASMHNFHLVGSCTS
jgi:RNA recognition motif-containing protein